MGKELTTGERIALRLTDGGKIRTHVNDPKTGERGWLDYHEIGAIIDEELQEG